MIDPTYRHSLLRRLWEAQTGDADEATKRLMAEAAQEMESLQQGLQNYMDACQYADKDTLVAAIGAAHKEAVRLLPRRI